MRRFLPALLLLLALVAGSWPASAGPMPAGSLGLQISLVTELSRFEIPADPAPVTTAVRKRAAATLRESFIASVALSNLSRSDVTLSYADAAAASDRFTFSLLDASGAVVWESPALTSTAATSPDLILKSKATLRRTVQVPLKTTSGAWLAAGKYTLHAAAGNGTASAAVPFEVAVSALPTGTGIQGQVFFREDSFPFPQPIIHPIIVPVIGLPAATNGSGITILPEGGLVPVPIQATVTISEIRDVRAKYDHPAFEWTGPTDSQGNFKVATPAGRFHLSASAPGIIEPNYVLPNWVTVTVAAGQYTTQNFTILGHRQSESQASLVYDVTYAVVVPQSDGSLHITAQGHASTTGWTNPQLVQQPSDVAGELDLDFVAVPPTGLAGQVVLPIQAQADFPKGSSFTTVRVRAKAGTVTATFAPQ